MYWYSNPDNQAFLDAGMYWYSNPENQAFLDAGMYWYSNPDNHKIFLDADIIIIGSAEALPILCVRCARKRFLYCA